MEPSCLLPISCTGGLWEWKWLFSAEPIPIRDNWQDVNGELSCLGRESVFHSGRGSRSHLAIAASHLGKFGIVGGGGKSGSHCIDCNIAWNNKCYIIYLTNMPNGSAQCHVLQLFFLSPHHRRFDIVWPPQMEITTRWQPPNHLLLFPFMFHLTQSRSQSDIYIFIPSAFLLFTCEICVLFTFDNFLIFPDNAPILINDSLKNVLTLNK